MILAIDMGNTNTVIGGIDEKKTYFIERRHHRPQPHSHRIRRQL